MKIRSCSPWSDLISDSVCQENAEECEDSLPKPFALKIWHPFLNPHRLHDEAIFIHDSDAFYLLRLHSEPDYRDVTWVLER